MSYEYTDYQAGGFISLIGISASGPPELGRLEHMDQANQRFETLSDDLDP